MAYNKLRHLSALSHRNICRFVSGSSSYSRLKMTVYVPNSYHLREVLIFCFNKKKSAAAAHRLLPNIYGGVAISERTFHEFFKSFKNGYFGHRVPALRWKRENFLKMQNWMDYLVKTHVKHKKNLQNHWERLNRRF